MISLPVLLPHLSIHMVLRSEFSSLNNQPLFSIRLVLRSFPGFRGQFPFSLVMLKVQVTDNLPQLFRICQFNLLSGPGFPLHSYPHDFLDVIFIIFFLFYNIDIAAGDPQLTHQAVHHPLDVFLVGGRNQCYREILKMPRGNYLVKVLNRPHRIEGVLHLLYFLV